MRSDDRRSEIQGHGACEVPFSTNTMSIGEGLGI